MALPGLLRFRLDAEHLPLEWVTIQRIPGRTSGSSAEAVQRWQRDTRPIGKGGYGKVWREHLDHGDRHVDFRAVKVCDADSDVNQRELQALMEFTQLSTSALFVHLYGWWDDSLSESICIAMEYFALGDLSQYIASVTEADCREIVKQLLQAVEVMHARGFAHRDIKPGNILVVRKRPDYPYWHVKLGDFGISKKVGEGSNTSLRTERRGTSWYSAPEVLGLIRPAGPKSSTYSNKVDIWSLGCVLFNLASGGDHAFDNSGQAYLEHYSTGTASFNSQSATLRLSPKGYDLLRRMLRVDPNERPHAPKALRSPWFSEHGGAGTSQITSSSFERARPVNSFLHSTKSNIAATNDMAATTSTSTILKSSTSRDRLVRNQQKDPLRELGQDIGVEDKYGSTPMHHAARLGQLAMVDHLRELGQDIGVEDKYGSTPMHDAAMSGQLAMVDHLQELGQDIGVKDMDGITPMHDAAMSGQLEMVNHLRELGQDIGVKDMDGSTPMHHAAKRGQLTMVDHLRELGQDIGVKDKYGITPMHRAAREGQLAMVSHLQKLEQQSSHR